MILLYRIYFLSNNIFLKEIDAFVKSKLYKELFS